MKRKRRFGSGAAIFTAVVAGALGFTSTAAFGVTAAVETRPIALGGPDTKFNTIADLEAQWASILSKYPEQLPTDVSFPDGPKYFFNAPSDDDKALYEEGLETSLLTRFWRCAWLEDSAANGEVAIPGLSAADSPVELDIKVMERFTKQLHMFKNQSTEEYNSIIEAAAQEQSIGVAEYEYVTECTPLIEGTN